MTEPSKASSSARKPLPLRPTDRGGWGQQKDKRFGGIVEKAYPARAKKPDHLGQVRILCVVGMVDQPIGTASPTNDGWWLSDFYYLHYLFRNVAKPQHQLWLTCLRPEYLVKRYKEFVHGNPRSNDRRVVLDQLLLDTTKDITVVPAETLRERFLNEVKDWTNEAALLDQQVLIIILGHGSYTAQGHRIRIGGTTFNAGLSPANSVSIKEFNRVCHPNVRATILTTACFSGAWVVSPALPNISMLSPVDPDKESLSWDMATLGRCCGSRYITGVTNALIRLNLPGMEITEDDEDMIEKGRIAIWGPSFAALCSDVHNEVQKIDTWHNAMSLAQNDEWYRYWQCLSGFRDGDILARREELRRVPWSTAPELQSSQMGRCKTGANDELFTFEQGTSVARARINEYEQSRPGPPNLANNIMLHNSIRTFLANEKAFSAKEVENLLAQLNYRIFDVTRQATVYKTILNMAFPNCEDFDNFEWREKARKSESAPTRQEIYSHVFQAAVKSQLFDEPTEFEGRPFMKGHQYLAAMFAESLWPRDRVDASLTHLAKWKSLNGKYAGAVQVMELSMKERVRHRLSEFSTRSGKRLRSISPRKSTARLRESVEALQEKGRDHLRRARHQNVLSMQLPPPTPSEFVEEEPRKERGRSLTR